LRDAFTAGPLVRDHVALDDRHRFETIAQHSGGTDSGETTADDDRVVAAQIAPLGIHSRADSRLSSARHNVESQFDISSRNITPDIDGSCELIGDRPDGHA
jgi:hypothetical protein